MDSLMSYKSYQEELRMSSTFNCRQWQGSIQFVEYLSSYHNNRSANTCPKFKRSAIISKWYEIGCQLVLITIINRKSHTGFRLVPTSMTLNDLERRSSPYFTEFDSLQVDYITVVEYRPIMSAKYRLSVIFGQNWPMKRLQSHSLFVTAQLHVVLVFITLTFYLDLWYHIKYAFVRVWVMLNCYVYIIYSVREINHHRRWVRTTLTWVTSRVMIFTYLHNIDLVRDSFSRKGNVLLSLFVLPV